MRRTAAVLGALAVGAAALVLGAAPAGAAGTLTPWSSSVAVGGMFSVTAGGCPTIEEEHEDGFTIQQAELVLITATGAGERQAAFGEPAGGTRYRFRVPGWVDPADPAVVAGFCTRTEYQFGTEDEQETVTTTTEFAYADAAIDITPGTAVPSGPVLSLDRSTAAGGQVVTVSGTGCESADFAQVILFEGSDLSGRTRGTYVAGGGAPVEADGSFTAEVPLNGYTETSVEGGPLAEGPYVVLGACGLEEEGGFMMGEPLALTVAGTNPSGSFVASVADGVITAMGGGCLGGQEVTVHLVGYSYSFGIEELDRQAGRALARRSVPDFAKAVEEDEGQFELDLTATPGPDGSWSVTTPAPDGSLELKATADCGDPTADGFRYVRRYVYDNHSADLYIDRASPTSSPAGGSVLLVASGMCDGETRVALVDQDQQIVSQSEPFTLNEYGMGSGTVQAPDRAGRVYTVGLCDDEMSYPDVYDVFEPETMSATAPLPDEPAEGWPSQGPRETYHGKIGPILLPAMDMDDGSGMEMATSKAMGPSGLFIPVPRPDGDFAITKLTFDLVDADGMPVDQEHAHLHHFVITNKSKSNPACPGSTFGLPGQIVGAAGAERTVLQTGDPYGLVVKDTDDWTGVYELMSRSMEDQEVFLSYDIDYRRDVQNVRPVTTYFGSATGCSSFTWTIDGVGTPDTQSHYVTIDKPGRLIGAGGHIHNGGMHADWTNDRGRQLCRSEISYGDEAVGHDMDMVRRPRALTANVEATTSMVDEPIPTDEYPPEFYDDDLVIEGISNCPLAESLSAGERLEFSATYENERARSGVMGVYTAYVWEGGGPAEPGPGGAEAIPGTPSYTG